MSRQELIKHYEDKLQNYGLDNFDKELLSLLKNEDVIKTINTKILKWSLEEKQTMINCSWAEIEKELIDSLSHDKPTNRVQAAGFASESVRGGEELKERTTEEPDASCSETTSMPSSSPFSPLTKDNFDEADKVRTTGEIFNRKWKEEKIISALSGLREELYTLKGYKTLIDTKGKTKIYEDTIRFREVSGLIDKHFPILKKELKK